jgi:hypothetical protein
VKKDRDAARDQQFSHGGNVAVAQVYIEDRRHHRLDVQQGEGFLDGRDRPDDRAASILVTIRERPQAG